jgi:hypothetical protein
MVDDNPSEKVAKVLIDDLSDFKLNAAYLAYSKAWVENLDEEVRLELNKLMLSLTENKGNYSTFYYELSQYGKNMTNDYFSRTRIKGEKKRAWRNREAKKKRISRHKK